MTMRNKTVSALQGHEQATAFYHREAVQFNGVLDVGRTVDVAKPVWCPIDQALYYAYLGGDRTGERSDKLTKEILTVLFTIGKNRFQGGKRADDASTRNVVEHALPLLKEVVNSFVSAPERRVNATR